MATGPGHPFYTKLNAVLAEAGFDEFVEKLGAPYYKEGGRPGIPPGVYFRHAFHRLLRGTGQPARHRLALRRQPGLARLSGLPVDRGYAGACLHDDDSPAVARERSLTRVFVFVLRLVGKAGAVAGQDGGHGRHHPGGQRGDEEHRAQGHRARIGKNICAGLAQAEGIENPTEEDLRRLDRGRKDKKVSNAQWESPTDRDSRIAKMKDGRTHLAYKAEHAVDLVSEAIVATTVTFADKSDPQSGPVTLSLAEANLVLAGSATEIAEAVMDKGYHDNGLLADLARQGVRTYIPERRQKRRCWTDKPVEQEEAFRANRRRVRGKKGRRLNRWRSERCERTFAHVCETGGGRRAWLRGQTNVSKAHTLKCAAYNLGVLLRKVWGLRKPRNADEGVWGGLLAFWAWLTLAAVIVYRTTTRPDSLFGGLSGWC